MNIVEQVLEEFVFEIECFSPDEFDQFRDMMAWISENATNGRVHFHFDGGMLGSNQQRMWMRGRITFTNDGGGIDATAFKLKWL